MPSRSIVSSYIISLVVVLMLAYCSRYLRIYSQNDKRVTAILIKSLSNDHNSSHHLDPELSRSIEDQMKCASTGPADLQSEFKKDSAAYPQNVLSQTFKVMRLMHSDVVGIVAEDSIIYYQVQIRDKNPITISAKFVKRKDELVLTDISNLCPLYQRMNCYREYYTKIAAIH